MYKITSIATGKIIIGCVPTEREATMVAIEETQRMLIRTAEGRRLIGWCKGRCTWDIAKQYVIVERMIGDWIFVKEAECVPEETTEDYDIVFILKRGLSRYLGIMMRRKGSSSIRAARTSIASLLNGFSPICFCRIMKKIDGSIARVV